MRDELLFGAIAVQEGYITAAQLSESLKDQDGSPLGEVLLRKGLLTEPQVQAILDIQKIHLAEASAASGSGGLFGQIALRDGLITPAQLHGSVREQLRLQQEGHDVTLGQIMIRKGFLTREQSVEILRRQDKHVLTCPECDTCYLILGYDKGTKFVCRRCLRLLIVPGIKPDGPEARAGVPRAELLSVGQGGAIGPYTILEELGRGSMSVVFKAHHKQLNKTVALKVLRKGAAPGPGFFRRFERETHASSRLFHPNVVAIRDAGQVDGIAYIAMDYIEGVTLLRILAERRLELPDLLRILEKVSRAAHFAHQQGIIHRDLKPANVMIDSRNEPHVLDFGLAKMTDARARPAGGTSALGTPYYMSPEQVEGDEEGTDIRSDIYSLGIILYEILTGRVPHAGSTVRETYHKTLSTEVTPPVEVKPETPPVLNDACIKATRRDKRLRHASAKEFADDLRRYLESLPPLTSHGRKT